MAVNFSEAARALNQAAALTKAPGIASPDSGGAGVEFSQLLKDAAKQAVEAGERGEAMTVKAVQGQADVAEVVTAVANAEITLQTVVAVRDKFIAAYQEILRMPI
ncbi:MAG: flagellar hook-basal body complex protein FliE [Alphaproteobacteria bacterium]|nr:flagellar hook-basal body complex protein FliE [Alphaproteobacteria bacterium]